MTSIEEALKGSNFAVKYSRVSTAAQEDRLPAQADTITKNLKVRGFKGRSRNFEEVGSGTKHTRPTLQEAILEALEQKKKGKKVVFVVGICKGSLGQVMTSVISTNSSHHLNSHYGLMIFQLSH